MTVAELIEELQEVEDKTKEVEVQDYDKARDKWIWVEASDVLDLFSDVIRIT